MKRLKENGNRLIKEQGSCFSSTCPLGRQCDEQDLEDYDEDGYWEGCDPFDLVLLDDETCTKLFNEGGEEI